ncbi:MAG: pentapeptide repeat-containing protein [Planctomycetota bacterium]
MGSVNLVLDALRGKGRLAERQAIIDNVTQGPAVRSPTGDAVHVPQYVLVDGFELSDVDLTGLNLSGIRITNAVLRNVVCNDVRFPSAQDCLFENMSGERVSFARLSNCRFVNASLPNAILGPFVEGCDFTAANLRHARLRQMGKEQHSERGQHAIFWNAEMSYCDAAGADLSRSSFVAARLTGARLSSAVLRDCDFTLADLQGANAARADLDGAILRGAGLQGVVIAHDYACREQHASGFATQGAVLLDVPPPSLFARLARLLVQQPDYHIAWRMTNAEFGVSEKVAVWTEEAIRPLSNALADKGQGYFRSFAIEGPRPVESIFVDIACDYIGWRPMPESLELSDVADNVRNELERRCIEMLEQLRVMPR